jgi:membrane fusion protein, copper/silver efflux system
MKTRSAVFSVVAALLFAAAGAGGGFWYATMRAEMREVDKQASAPMPPGKKILYWHDPMYPQQKFDKPGKSPFMEMQLVPVYADDDVGVDGTKAGVKVNPAAAQSLGARTADAKRAMLSRSIEAVGTVAFDESAVEVVQARVSGWIEKLHVRTPNDPVAAGAPLASIYAPDWLGAQEEYLAVKKSGSADLIGAARARLAHLGIPEAQIAALERDGRANPRVTLVAPRGGVLLPLSADMSAGAAAFAPQFAKEGMQVTPGMTLFRIASLTSVWVLADVPEAQSGSLRAGNPVEVRVQAFADRSFKGAIAVLLPEVNTATRTVRARIRADNPGGLLKPGMFAAVRLGGDDKREAIVVPSEAVIATGARKLVMIAGASGRFAQRDVETGLEARVDGIDVTEIRRGVEAGEKVVVSGQFLFDSEASLKGGGAVDAAKSVSGSASPADTPAGKPAEHRGEARVEKISGDAVTLSHGPIPSMKWPDMTMDFRAPKAGLPRNVASGDRVAFSFKARADGQFELTHIAPMAPVPTSAPASEPSKAKK